MMECNKDEALRAKEIAEKKMQNNDFDGAQKIAIKAQQLFPELENINQLLTVCNVHCAAQNRIFGSEKDFYGILQLEKFTDEVTIKKQYRKLALILHPDKNKFPGAEAAFKLIGEASVMLLDPGKKSLYDNKCKVFVRTAQAKPQPHQVNRNPPANRQFQAQGSIPNSFGHQFSSLNHKQPTTSNPSVVQHAFWTSCPYCNTKYQYLKKHVNSVVPCQRCSKRFTAYDHGVQGAPSGFNLGQTRPHGEQPGQAGAQVVPPSNSWNQPPTTFPPKEIPRSASYRTGVPPSAGFPASHPGSQGRASRTVISEPGTMAGSTADFGGTGKPDIKDVNQGMSKADAGKPREAAVRNKGRKRGRKQTVESSESCDTSSSNDSEEVIIEEDGATSAAGLDSGVNGFHCTRRSSRHRQNVSYNENGSDDDDFESPPQMLRKSKTFGDEVKKEAVSKDKSKTSSTSADDIKANVKPERKGYSEGNLADGISQMGENQQASGAMGNGAYKVEIIDDSESDLDPGGRAEQEFYQCLDPEFSDFDKDKDESCFAVDQIWALYDTVDGMPRFYAQIKKVFKPGFKLRINWLEADPEDKGEFDWANSELPFGCGRFKRGTFEMTTDRLTFSHQIQYGKGKSKSSFVIYPRKGEIWALFKDWDIKWCLDPDNHRKYKYEFVEVVSDFVEGAGSRVAYLEKVRGFVSLFERASLSETDFLLIPPNQLLRFSHRIPSCKMTGTEKQGVPVGSFELDPASLPNDPDDIWYPRKIKEDNERLNTGIAGSSRKPEFVTSPLRYADCKGKSNMDESYLRRSPRGVKINDKRQN